MRGCADEELVGQPGCRKTAKKTKDKAFARSVSRQDITEGALELGVQLEVHVDFCVKAMQARAAELGLAGNSATSG
jgi:predicted hydrolase (HD superfamily)